MPSLHIVQHWVCAFRSVSTNTPNIPSAAHAQGREEDTFDTLSLSCAFSRIALPLFQNSIWRHSRDPVSVRSVRKANHRIKKKKKNGNLPNTNHLPAPTAKRTASLTCSSRWAPQSKTDFHLGRFVAAPVGFVPPTPTTRDVRIAFSG